MYSILIATDKVHPTPFIISQNCDDFVDFLFYGYETIATGTRKECESILEEAMTAYSD